MINAKKVLLSLWVIVIFTSCQFSKPLRLPTSFKNQGAFGQYCARKYGACSEYALTFLPASPLDNICSQIEKTFPVYVGTLQPEKNRMTVVMPDFLAQNFKKLPISYKFKTVEKEPFEKGRLKEVCPNLWKSYFLVGFQTLNQRYRKQMLALQKRIGYSSDAIDALKKHTKGADLGIIYTDREQRFLLQVLQLQESFEIELLKRLFFNLRDILITSNQFVTVFPDLPCPKVETILQITEKQARHLRKRQNNDFYIQRMPFPYVELISSGNVIPLYERVGQFYKDQCTFTIYDADFLKGTHPCSKLCNKSATLFETCLEQNLKLPK